ncbi:MAG: cell division protein ZapA [Candidatus Accumulibacter sp.]|jgi:cell division protein ZapA|nr:cell division protein ZapA [Accumulibacter sp.]
MSSDASFLDIVLLGKEYRVACPPGEEDALRQAVDHVDGKMREIAGKTHNNAAERIAVVAALNIAHEFLLLQSRPPEADAAPDHRRDEGLDIDAAKRRIEHMEAELDAVLTPQDKLI